MPKTGEKYATDAILCGHCGNLGRNRIMCEYNDVRQMEYESDVPFVQTWEAGTYWELVQCGACNYRKDPPFPLTLVAPRCAARIA